MLKKIITFTGLFVMCSNVSAFGHFLGDFNFLSVDNIKAHYVKAPTAFLLLAAATVAGSYQVYKAFKTDSLSVNEELVEQDKEAVEVVESEEEEEKEDVEEVEEVSEEPAE